MTADPNTGGPAFPSSYATPAGPQAYDDNHGISLMDWFAGIALQGYIASGVRTNIGHTELAEKCYRAAAAMVVERRR